MKRKLLLCATLFLLVFLLSACGNVAPDPTPTVYPTATVNPVSTPEPIETEMPDLPTITTEPDNPEEFVAVLFDSDNTDVYRQLTLKKGMKIDYATKKGYDFKGYWTEGDNPVCYIDETGTVIKPYIGTDALYLKSRYTPYEFTVRIYDGETIYDTKTVNYDAKLLLSMYLGEIIDNKCVVALETEDGKILAAPNYNKRYTLQNLKGCKGIDINNKTAKINLVTEPLKFLWDRYDTYNVTESGFLKQSLNSRGVAYDQINLADYCDIDALESLGYTKAKITIKCEIAATSGTQFIKLLSSIPQKEKDIKSLTLFDSGTISLANKAGNSETYKVSTTIPLESLSDAIYIFYNASGSVFVSDKWSSYAMSINFTIEK